MAGVPVVGSLVTRLSPVLYPSQVHSEYLNLAMGVFLVHQVTSEKVITTIDQVSDFCAQGFKMLEIFDTDIFLVTKDRPGLPVMAHVFRGFSATTPQPPIVAPRGQEWVHINEEGSLFDYMITAEKIRRYFKHPTDVYLVLGTHPLRVAFMPDPKIIHPDKIY